MDLSSGFLGLVLGAFLGLFLSVAFEDALKRRSGRIFRRVRSRLVRVPTSVQRQTFALGPLTTTTVIVEGDGENPIAESAITLSIDHAMVQLPIEMAAWREEIAQSPEAGNPRWNGLNYAIAGFAISREPLVESPEVLLRLQHSDYFTFLATQQLDRPFADGSTPRSRYVDPFPLETVPAFMASSLGTNMAVVTADNCLVVSRRSDKVGSHPGRWSASANEALSRSIDSRGRDVPNLYDVARRGLMEELAIGRDECRLDLLAFTVDVHAHQWGALFVGRLDTVTSTALQERWNRGVADRWEHDEHVFVPFNVRSVLRFVLDPARAGHWAPQGPVINYLALVHQFGRSTVERGIGDALEWLARQRAVPRRRRRPAIGDGSVTGA